MSFCQLLLLTHALFLQSKFRCELNCLFLLCLYWFETSCLQTCTTQIAFFFSLTSNYGLCFPHPGISQLPSLFSILVESETPELNIIEIMRSHQRCWAPAEQSFLFLLHFLWADWAPSRLGFPSSEESCVCEAQALSLLCWVLWNTNSAALAQRAEGMFGVCKHWALKVISEFTLVQ